MTTVINLFGASGVGKSTTAAATFARFKLAGKSAELVSEYIKAWAWEGRMPNQFDQLYIFGKQARKESILYGKVDYIITDSPLWLSAFYENACLGREIITPAIKNYMDFIGEQGVKQMNFWLTRNKPYDPNGRYESEEQSKKNHELMFDFFTEKKVPLVVLSCDDKDRADNIYEMVVK